MRSRTLRSIFAQLLIASVAFIGAVGCSTAPKQSDQAAVISDSRGARSWFTGQVSGLSQQLDNSGGYIVYPGIGQYGILIGGGKFGAALVYDNNHRQVGWAYLNTASAGLQVGAQGFKMLVVFEDSATMRQFQVNKLTGNVGATAVAADSGAITSSSFTNGVAVYQGAQTGLMAGVSVGLDYMRYESVADAR